MYERKYLQKTGFAKNICKKRQFALLMKTNKTIALLPKLQALLARAPLTTSYKLFIRPHLDYGDTIYDQTLICGFDKNWKSFSIMKF